jgi:diacylglycerol kinase (ATP)
VKQRAAVICNPVKVDLPRLRAAVTAEEERAGWRPSVWFDTTADDSGQIAARKALEARPSVVLVVGGDGTIRAVAEEVRASGTPLALIPAGTGNLLARNLRLPLTNLEFSVHTAFTGTDRMIDIVLAELERPDHSIDARTFCVMAGIGLDADMAVNTNSTLKKRIGWLAYTDPISKSVLANKQFAMHYTIDGSRQHSVRAHTVIVGNCGTLTANILLLPNAVIDDGLVDVVLLRPKGVGGWARVGSRLAIGGLLHRTKAGRLVLRGAPNLRALQYVQARQLHVRFNVPQQIELDGDSFGAVVGVAITTEHNGLIVRVPQTGRTPLSV